MAKRKKKQTPIRIRKSDEAEYKRLVSNAKAKIRRTKKNYGIDISSEINLPQLESFKTRKAFNEWKEEMKRIKNRADLKFKKVDGMVASQKTILQSTLEAKAIINRMEKKGRSELVNKKGTVFTRDEIKKMTLQANVSREQQIRYKEMVKNLPAFKEANKELSEKERERQLERSTGVSLTAKFNPDVYRSQKEKELKEESLEKGSRAGKFEEDTSVFRKNFLKRNMNFYGENSDDFDRLIKNMSDAEFLNFYEYYKDDVSLNIYGSKQDSEEQLQGFQQMIKEVMEDYKQVKQNIKNLEGF